MVTTTTSPRGFIALSSARIPSQQAATRVHAALSDLSDGGKVSFYRHDSYGYGAEITCGDGVQFDVSGASTKDPSLPLVPDGHLISEDGTEASPSKLVHLGTGPPSFLVGCRGRSGTTGGTTIARIPSHTSKPDTLVPFSNTSLSWFRKQEEEEENSRRGRSKSDSGRSSKGKKESNKAFDSTLHPGMEVSITSAYHKPYRGGEYGVGLDWVSDGGVSASVGPFEVNDVRSNWESYMHALTLHDATDSAFPDPEEYPSGSGEAMTGWGDVPRQIGQGEERVFLD